MIDEKQELPHIEIYSLAEMQRMALHVVLRDRGIDEPAEYLRKNVVNYKTAFKANVGLAITITGIQPKNLAEG
jgi:hypothetical protein